MTTNLVSSGGGIGDEWVGENLVKKCGGGNTAQQVSGEVGSNRSSNR